MKIGIYGISTQSGQAFLADYISKGFEVIGYARPTSHGKSFVDAIYGEKGIWIERPENQNMEPSRFVNLDNNIVTHELETLVNKSDFIIIPIPAHYHLEAITEMAKAGLQKRKVPIVLAPARTFATPYLWNILGDNYPVISFSTSPYSSKTIAPGKVYLKRRKRTWMVNMEGHIEIEQIQQLENIFPQAAISNIPALVSLNNIGAIFHPAAYILNIDEIKKRENTNNPYSFYIEGIANKENVAEVIDKIDQVRLQIANEIGIDTFGLRSNPREDIWRKLTNGMRALEEEHENEIDVLRRIRKQFLEYINNCVISAQHWLDITYGVIRMPGESLAESIRRTPTYQKNSVPQTRYVEEDIPTGLVPLEALAEKFNIPHNEISEIIDRFDSLYSINSRATGRNLSEFSNEYLIKYLTNRNSIS